MKTAPIDEEFGSVCICAVRYAMGRRTYMPGIVTGYITQLIPQLDSRVLGVLDMDLATSDNYGDPNIDKPIWENFHEAVKRELQNRGKKLYER